MSRASRANRRKSPLSDAGPPLSPLPPAIRSPQGVWRLALPLILLLYLGFAGLHAHTVPVGVTGYQNAPDEAAHVTYVRVVASGRLPTQNDPAPGIHPSSAFTYEWHQPPLYYAMAVLFLPLGEIGLRSCSILCGLICLLLIYRTGHLLIPDDPRIGILAAGIAAWIPTHVAITSTVNNDALLEVCFSWAILLLISSLQSGFTFWRGGWLGVAIGAAILTKVTGLLLIPVALLALLLFRRAGESPETLRRSAGWALLIVLAISGWWFVRNLALYHELLPLHGFQAAFAGTMQSSAVADQVGGWSEYLLMMGQGIFKSFWAVYGTPQDVAVGRPRFLPDPIYSLMLVISLVALAGLIRLHFRRKIELTDSQRNAIYVLFSVLALVGLSFFLFILRYFQMQGRYLYPAMLPICLLFALGWRSAIPDRYQSLAYCLLLALFAAVTLIFLRTIAAL